MDSFGLEWNRHADHLANVNDYAGSTWLVQVVERDAMFGPAAREGSSFENHLELETSTTILLNGDHDVFGDGSVLIKSTPGHTLRSPVSIRRARKLRPGGVDWRPLPLSRGTYVRNLSRLRVGPGADRRVEGHDRRASGRDRGGAVDPPRSDPVFGVEEVTRLLRLSPTCSWGSGQLDTGSGPVELERDLHMGRA